jgi:hypothetical protein
MACGRRPPPSDVHVYVMVLPALSRQLSMSHAAGGLPGNCDALVEPRVHRRSVLSVTDHEPFTNSISSPVLSTTGRYRLAPIATRSPAPTSEYVPVAVGSGGAEAGVILVRIVISPSDHPIPNGPSPDPAEYCSVNGGMIPFGPAGSVKSNFAAAVPVLRSTLKPPP